MLLHQNHLFVLGVRLQRIRDLCQPQQFFLPRLQFLFLGLASLLHFLLNLGQLVLERLAILHQPRVVVVEVLELLALVLADLVLHKVLLLQLLILLFDSLSDLLDLGVVAVALHHVLLVLHAEHLRLTLRAVQVA